MGKAGATRALRSGPVLKHVSNQRGATANCGPSREPGPRAPVWGNLDTMLRLSHLSNRHDDRPVHVLCLLLWESIIVVQPLSRIQPSASPWTAARQASLSITNSQSPPKPMYIESVMPSNHLILCHPLLLLPPNFLSIGVFSNESTLCVRWPKYWNFGFSIGPSNEYSGFISFRIDWFDVLAVQWDS